MSSMTYIKIKMIKTIYPIMVNYLEKFKLKNIKFKKI